MRLPVFTHAFNRSVNLPDAEIVVHRADGSGTTFAFTDFLAKTSSEWQSAVGSGTTVRWPTGQPELASLARRAIPREQGPSGP